MDIKRQLFNYALRLLGGRRYTSAQLQKKLDQKLKKMHGGLPENYASPPEEAAGHADDAARVIERLKELRLLDDREYANLYIADQLRGKPQGIRMLKMRMIAKGLPKDIIGQALEAAGLDETQLARAAAAKKLKSIKGLPPQKRREKLARFLAARGFNSRSITSVLKSYPSNVEEDYQSP